MKTFYIAMTVLCASLALTAHGQVYKWVDKNGKTQYSDQPPPPGATDAEAIKINKGSGTGAPVSTPAAAAAAPDGKAGDKQPKLEPAEKAKKDADAARAAKDTAEWCRDANNRLRTLQDGGRISTTNAEGERGLMTDEQITQATAKLNQSIAETCK